MQWTEILLNNSMPGQAFDGWKFDRVEITAMKEKKPPSSSRRRRRSSEDGEEDELVEALGKG